MNTQTKLETETVTLPDGTQGRVTHSSGNVFADLGLPDANELQWKAKLLDEIGDIIQSKGWAQEITAQNAGLNRSEVSRLVNGRIGTFSVERLLLILNRLGHSVEMRVSTRAVSPEQAHTTIRTVARVG